MKQDKVNFCVKVENADQFEAVKLLVINAGINWVTKSQTDYGKGVNSVYHSTNLGYAWASCFERSSTEKCKDFNNIESFILWLNDVDSTVDKERNILRNKVAEAAMKALQATENLEKLKKELQELE